ncbi:hypothetical protein HD554DRAFT_2040696 [Boletus coccyginus]|nr:hypothetical protein HD554DRAFT_2040696 [Boletus coccyginus]
MYGSSNNIRLILHAEDHNQDKLVTENLASEKIKQHTMQLLRHEQVIKALQAIKSKTFISNQDSMQVGWLREEGEFLQSQAGSCLKTTKPHQDNAHALSTTNIKTTGKDYFQAADCDSIEHQVLLTAIEIYYMLLLTKNPYFTLDNECEWAKDSLFVRLGQHITHLHEQFKMRAQAVIGSVYGFKVSADLVVIENNRELVQMFLMNFISTFCWLTNFKVSWSKSNKGVKWVYYYDLFSYARFVLAVAVIHYTINKWAQAQYKLVHRLLQKVYDNGWEKKMALLSSVFKNAIHDYQSSTSSFN